MRYTCFPKKIASATALTALAIAVGVFAAAFTIAAPAAQTKLCALVEPQFKPAGASVVFEITIDCESKLPHARPFPVGSDVLLGLTVYAAADVKAVLRNGADNFARRVIEAAPEIDAALKGATQSKTAMVASAPKWIVLTDSEARSYDFKLKTVRIDAATKRLLVQFQADSNAIAGMQHMVFAAWPKSARLQCDSKDKYARSGCRRDGFVLGDGVGVGALTAYPGLEINEFRHQNGDEWTSERWIVERFR